MQDVICMHYSALLKLTAPQPNMSEARTKPGKIVFYQALKIHCPKRPYLQLITYHNKQALVILPELDTWTLVVQYSRYFIMDGC